jgi:TRAP-type C4-dicarboxylate transport system permease small subunit
MQGADNEDMPGGHPGLVDRLNGLVAVAGGCLALGMAALVVTSVLGRWLFSAPIDGDFEFVKMGTAMAVFCYLPYAQVRGANIMVDTFTLRLPQAWQMRLDALWDLVFAGFMLFCAYALWFGTQDALKSGTTTMQRQIVIWPSIAFCMVLAALVAVTAVVTASAKLQRTALEPKP